MSRSTARHKRHPYEPCYLFEAGILSLDRYPIRGVIWYQGESNAHNFEAHERLFKLLVGSWRAYWNNTTMPLLLRTTVEPEPTVVAVCSATASVGCSPR